MTGRWFVAAAVLLVLAAWAFGPRHGEAAPESKTAIFAGGCFWCMEAAFDEVDGVTETISGYAGGTAPNPTYGQHEGYQEAVRVTYDPAKATYAKLLDQYWHNIDPFDSEGQFCDQGNAYRSRDLHRQWRGEAARRLDQAGDRRALQAAGGNGDQTGPPLSLPPSGITRTSTSGTQ